MENTKQAKVEEITHEIFIKAIGNLVNQLKGQQYSFIIPIPRGGLVPATYLSHALDIPICSIDIVSFPGWERPGKMLFVEDVVDTGITTEGLKREGIIRDNDAVATIVYKPWSTYKPDFYALLTTNWIKFEWETH